ncbi:MAG: transposase [Christensenellaceae bacterium]|jgi:transposase|nr:transposase [Christensenellaceae bacterium]
MEFNNDHFSINIPSDVLKTNIGKKLAAISENPSLPQLAKRIDKVLFSRKDPSKGGRPRFKTETMLKILILKWLYNLSYVNVVDHIKVNLAYQFFIGMTSGFPDDHTVNDFNTLLRKHYVIEELFEKELGIMKDDWNNGR